MTVLATSTTRVVVQGITGRQASWSTREMITYGTRIVAGVVPGKGGTLYLDVPIFDFVEDAVAATGADASIVFVPPAAAAEAIAEALEAAIGLVVYPGDGLPVHDAIWLRRRAQEAGAVLVGPNTPGLIAPRAIKLGFMPAHCYMPGPVGVITKSGSLSYEICRRLTENGIGQSTVVGVGGDPVKGLTIGEAIALFHDDPDTRAILVVGEIGGTEEYQAAAYAVSTDAKPIASFLVGKTAPIGRKLGHAGALIGTHRETYAAKVAALAASRVRVIESLAGIPSALSELLA